MKFILSRKGFDSGAGGCASPIIGNRLISLPIPEKFPKEAGITYEQLSFVYNQNDKERVSYSKLINDLLGRNFPHVKCHLDPDINEDAWNRRPDGWRAAFGPYMPTFGKHLNMENENCVKEGDIFLFFGWFREIEKDNNGNFRYKKGSPDIHAIYGYMQVWKILDSEEKKKEYCRWHPHVEGDDHIILPTDNLKFSDDDITEFPGYGLFNYGDNVILTDTTQEYCRRSFWKKNAITLAKWDEYKYSNEGKEYFYKRGRWQEYIYDDNSNEILEWFKEVLVENFKNSKEKP